MDFAGYNRLVQAESEKNGKKKIVDIADGGAGFCLQEWRYLQFRPDQEQGCLV
jgi:hypothetical protein